MKTYKQYISEGLIDKMAPVTDDDLKNRFGEENYKKYKMLSDAKDSIKNKSLAWDVEYNENINELYFELHVMLNIFTTTIKNGKWVLNYRDGYNEVYKKFDTWEETREHIRDVIRDKLNKNIEEKQGKIDKLQSEIKRTKDIMDEINENI